MSEVIAAAELPSHQPLETWALVEIMGHNKVAGRVTERKLGINVLIQVDVPKGEKEFSHTQLYSPSALFAIHPTTEAWCRQWAAANVSHDPLPYIPQTRQIENGEDFD